LIILMENKRETSTALQLNRYLVHSITSHVSNRKKLAAEIMDGPIRSLGDSFVRLSQHNWYYKALDNVEAMTSNRITNLISISNDYDRFHMESFFDLEVKIEFSRIMDEMYLCNLFDKESGFSGHMMKQIADKQEKMEILFNSIRHKDESKGNINDVKNFLKEKDQFHTFDKKFVVSATKKYFSSTTNKVKLKEAEIKVINSVVNSAMMMTASLKSGPYASEAMDFSTNIVKSKSFESLFLEVEKLSSNVLLEMCEKMDTIEAIFAMFPKAQIGGSREILIQAVQLRVIVKFLETYSKEMCKMHDKEMLTKTFQRPEIQSDTLAEMREVMRASVKRGNNTLFFSMNADASKWSPSFVMENFMHFVYNWDINEDVKMLLLSVVSSFSSKRMLVPDALKRKWDDKDKNLKEFSEGVQSFKEQAYENNYVVELMSGMGQGMFHFLSSFYHCVMDDLNEQMSKDILMKTVRTTFIQKVMKSSDDSTSIGMMMFGKNLNNVDKALRAYIFLLDSFNRLSNIHMNWKKSGLNFIISEFNSLFSIGKRMVWATIKDIYTSNSIPDLTSPEEAVVFFNSNIRRAFEHGVYLTTIKIMMRLANKQLKRYYQMDQFLVDNLKMLLKCEEDLLPYQLGFFPEKMPVETMMFGLEVNMFNPKNSKELMVFYDRLYSAEKVSQMSKSKKMVPFAEESMGKFWFELPSRLDKQLQDMKDKFFTSMLKMDMESINKQMNKNALNFNLSHNDMKNYTQFTMEYFVGMNRKYEFQETMVVHSLVRALQLSRSKGKVYPKLKMTVELENKMENLKSKFMDPDLSATERSEVAKEMKRMELEMDTFNVDLCSFVSLIMNRDKKSKSCLKLMKAHQRIALNHLEINKSLDSMNKSTRFYHPTMKTLRFYASDMMLNLNSEEIINHIFNPKSAKSNAMENAMEELCDMIDFKNKDMMHENPFNFIETFMSMSDRPFKDFKDYLALNQKNLKFMKVTMLTDSYDTGSLEENVLNLYRTRLNPDFSYERKTERWNKDYNTLNFLSEISLNQENSDFISMELAKNINSSDNKMIRAMKLRTLSKDQELSSFDVLYDRVEFRTYKDKFKVKTMAWSNLSTLILVKDQKPNLDVYIYSDQDLDLSMKNNRIFNLFKKDMMDYDDSRYKVNYMNKGKWSNIFNVRYNISNMSFRTNILRKATKWTIELQVSSSRFKHFKDNDTTNVTFNILTDSYTVNDEALKNLFIYDAFGDEIQVKELMDDIPDLQSLDTILLRNGWMYEIELKEASYFNPVKEIKSTYTLQEINASFGQESMKNTLMSLIPTALMDEVRENEIEINNSNFSAVTEGAKSAMQNFLNKISEEESMDNSNEVDLSGFKEKNSVIKLMDYMITVSITKTLDIDKKKMGMLWNSTKGSKISENNFHSMVLWQVRNSFDFKLSNIMSAIVYNCILKNYMTTVSVKPHDNMKWMGIEARSKVDKSNLFIVRKKDDKAMLDSLNIFN